MTLTRFLRPLSAALVLLSVGSGPVRAEDPQAFDSFYVFGDSLADNGNVWLTSAVLVKAGQIAGPPPPPEGTYYQGRFSNGPVAFEYLWETLKKPGSPALVPYIAAPVLRKTGAVNFAFGGTGTPVLDQTPGGLWAPGLLGQVGLFKLGLRGKSPSKYALYAIVSGANDYRVGAFNEPMAPNDVVANIIASIDRLYALGARNVLLLTLPDLGKLPYLTPEQAAQGSAVAAAHNGLLAAGARDLAARHSQLKLTVVNVDDAFVRLQGLGVPSGFAAIDVLHPWPIQLPDGTFVMTPPPDPQPVPMSACLFVAPALCATLGTFETPFPLLFWDVVHPTTFAHSFLANYMLERLRQ